MPTKPTAGTSIVTGQSVSSGLLYAYPCDALPETERVSGASTTSAGSPSPSQVTDGTFGLGYRNNDVTNKYINTNLAAGFVKGRSRYSIMALCKVDTVPGNNDARCYVYDCRPDSASSSRLFVAVSNNRYTAVGVKWMIAFRTGDGSTTAYYVHAGSGGTTVTDGTLWNVIFTFDSVNDVHTLYLNGSQEAQLSQAVDAVTNVNPSVPPRFLTLTNGFDEAAGSIHGVHFWDRVLTSAEIAALAADPWLMYRPVVTGTAAVSAAKAAVGLTAANTPPLKTGTAAVTAAKPTVAISGASAPPPRTGTAAVTASKPTVAVSGLYAPPLKTGMAAVAASKPIVVAIGVFIPLKTGTAEVAAAKPIIAAGGAYTTPLKTGTVAVEAVKPTIAVSGTFTPPNGGAVVAAKPTIAASGVFIPLVTGTAVVVAAQAAAAIAATRTSPDKTGTIGVTASPATIALSGTYAPPLKTGTVAVTAAKSAVAVTGAYAPPLKTGTSAVAAAKATTAASGVFIPLKTGTGVVAARNAVVALTGIVAGPTITGTVAVAAARAAVAIYGDLIVLPPPSLSGFRVGAWFRPA